MPVGRLAGCRKGSIPPRLRGSMAPLRRGAMGDDPGLQRGCGFAPRSPGSLGSPDPPDQGCIPGPQGDPDRFRAAPLGRLRAIRLMAVPLALCRLRQRFHLGAYLLEIGFQGFRVIRREALIQQEAGGGGHAPVLPPEKGDRSGDPVPIGV